MLLDTIYNFLHMLATATWIGGMLFMKLVLLPAQAAIDPPQRGKLMGVAASRFTTVAWTSAVVLVVTGLLKTPAGRLMDFSSRFGTALAVKHLLIAAMIVIGLVISLGVVPKLKSLAPAPGQPSSQGLVRAQGRLDLLSAINTVLGLLVLLAVAVMRS
jgi:uncharacterized membrane protein